MKEAAVIEQTALCSYIAGARVAPDASSPRISSFDGKHTLAVAETSSVQLRRALRYADECQRRVEATSLHERIEVARLLVDDYERRAEQACWAIANFRGLTSADTRWMCQVNVHWSQTFEGLIDVLWGSSLSRQTPDALPRGDTQYWRSKGKAALLSSSTMDGPAAVVLICHAILSGTHVLFKPSFRDAATHLAFETLYDHGLAHYAQLVRWRSEAPEADQLNRQLLNNTAQAVIFSSNETYRAMLDRAAEPGTVEWDALHQRVKRYGTGLPLAIVSASADLDEAARDLVEGARLGGGRFCLSAGPVLVERSCHDALVERLIAHAARLRAGPPLEESTELSSHDPADSAALREVLRTFGGRHVFGSVRESDMDVQVLAHVPTDTPALFRELPGTLLAVIPVDDMAEVQSASASALRKNLREAWTAVVFFGDDSEFAKLPANIPAFRYLQGGVVARVKLLLPHQGAYFALDLMRRVTLESTRPPAYAP
jgi:acyl-CoA reductase-like NAD-dependent aldehyde dehydrogenase